MTQKNSKRAAMLFVVLALGVIVPAANAADPFRNEDHINRLEREVNQLRNRVAVLEKALAGSGVTIASTKASDENHHYVCSISAFTDRFEADDSNRGKARLKAQRACIAKHDEMFCRSNEIRCTEY